MATKKKKTKTTTVKEVLTAQVSDVVASMVELENEHREAMGAIRQRLVEAVEDVQKLEALRAEKEEELKQIHGAEAKLDDMAALQRQYDELKADHDHKVAMLKRDFAESQRELEAKESAQERARAWQLEDEERKREQMFAANESELVRRGAELDAREAELGSFDDRLKHEIEKRAEAMNRESKLAIKEAAAEHRAEKAAQEARMEALRSQVADLQKRLATAEDARNDAMARTAAIATSVLDKESGAQALNELRAVAHKQADAKK